MFVDKCERTFKELADAVLPAHFQRLADAIKNPLSASQLIGFKSANKQALAAANCETDFAGCYVFLDEGQPIYVGISRNVIKRLTQHLNHVSHYSASLVYRMASGEYAHKMKRNEAMEHAAFLRNFEASQGRLQQMQIAFIAFPDDHDLELYLFEVYASMALKTGKWNTFRTH